MPVIDLQHVDLGLERGLKRGAAGQAGLNVGEIHLGEKVLPQRLVQRHPLPRRLALPVIGALHHHQGHVAPDRLGIGRIPPHFGNAGVPGGARRNHIGQVDAFHGQVGVGRSGSERSLLFV